ncbi:acyltransferase [Fictibacillus sp. NRS-1165]|uniref:acyltransferase n=1 Tax=Fictibacillus sp. NRS-1165 TaxID=3144463 RepID=UPI003D1A7C31
MNNNQPRDPVYFNEIHFLRAFACIGVLLVHISAAYYNHHGQVFNWFTFGINQLARFGTPTFAVISGFLLFFQVRRRGFYAKSFIKSRTAKIIMPFLIWSLFYLLITKYVVHGSIPADPKEFLIKFTLGESFYHLYFMAIVIQFYLLFPVFQLIKSTKAWGITLFVTFCINAYFSRLKDFSFFENRMDMLIMDRVFLLSWIFFFMFGGFMAYHWDSVVRFTKNRLLLLSALSVLVYAGAIMEYKIMGSVASKRMTNLINIPVLCLASIGLYVIIQKLPFIRDRLYTVGTLSMGIYLVHPVVILFVSKVMPKQGWQTETLPFMFVLVLALTVFLVKLIQLMPFYQYVIPVPRPKGKLHHGRRDAA